MALDAGDSNATSGLSKSIYDALNDALGPDIPEDQLPAVQKGWKKLAGAIAKGVVDHLKNNMEIKDIQTSGTLGQDGRTVTASQTGSTTQHVQ